MISVESRLKEHPVGILISLIHRANSQIWRSGTGESRLPTVLVEWRSVRHADLTPLSDPVFPEATREAARIVIERYHRVDRLILLRRKIIDEVQRRMVNR